MQFLEYREEKTPNFCPAVPFFGKPYMKHLSKRQCFKKPPLPRKIPGYAPEEEPKNKTKNSL